MKEAKKLQRLHQLSVKGEILTATEQTALQNWYKTLDREEELILNNSQPIQDTEDLREQLADTTKQVAKISREIESLVAQNSNLCVNPIFNCSK
ncbi:MAG TPA: hypothetical protein VGP58_01625, partial [Pyrinomonadaceae bacterium]|jgi:cell division protein FtsB|nr:hypothetical protein [Pyrinomonadaceae bacterium]